VREERTRIHSKWKRFTLAVYTRTAQEISMQRLSLIALLTATITLMSGTSANAQTKGTYYGWYEYEVWGYYPTPVYYGPTWTYMPPASYPFYPSTVYTPRPVVNIFVLPTVSDSAAKAVETAPPTTKTVTETKVDTKYSIFPPGKRTTTTTTTTASGSAPPMATYTPPTTARGIIPSWYNGDRFHYAGANYKTKGGTFAPAGADWNAEVPAAFGADGTIAINGIVFMKE
jgi:hypothetical protein